jgi:TIR domain/NACHT domain
MPGQEEIKVKRIFVSYRRVEPDQTVAHAVADALRQHNEVFIDTDILPGSEWSKEVEDALQETDFLIALVSELAAESSIVVREVEIAHERRVKTGKPIIVPVRLRCDGPLGLRLDAYINPYQYIRWRGVEDNDQLISQLIGVVASERTRRRRHAPVTRERLRAISSIRHDWIDGYLKASICEGTRFEMSFAENPKLVEWPLDIVVQRPFQKARQLAPGTPLSSVFDQHVGQLLILGAPGSGKTTLLLQLAEELLDRAEANANMPIPFVFNLSSWAARRRPLADWLVEEMNEQYNIRRQLAQEWVDKEEILPLLDGLDEVAPKHRNACVEAINTFRKEHGFVHIVVCSRTEEYETLTARPRLPCAVVVQALTQGAGQEVHRLRWRVSQSSAGGTGQ